MLVPALEREVVTLGRRLPAAGAARASTSPRATAAGLATRRSSKGCRTASSAAGRRSSSTAFDARCFFQGHAGLLEALVEAVVGRRRAASAPSTSTAASAFSRCRSRGATRRSTLVEGDRIAARYARKNARANPDSAERRSRWREAVESWVASGLAGRRGSRRRRPAARRPLDGSVRRAARRTRAAAPDLRLVPPGGARARPARARPGSTIESLVLLDLFPQTGHMEVVVDLERRPDAAARDRRREDATDMDRDTHAAPADLGDDPARGGGAARRARRSRSDALSHLAGAARNATRITTSPCASVARSRRSRRIFPPSDLPPRVDQQGFVLRRRRRHRRPAGGRARQPAGDRRAGRGRDADSGLDPEARRTRSADELMQRAETYFAEGRRDARSRGGGGSGARRHGHDDDRGLPARSRPLVAHVGDSRAYRFRDRRALQRLTQDQTMAQALADAGVIAGGERRCRTVSATF